MPEATVVEALDLDDLPHGDTYHLRIALEQDADGRPMTVPVIVRRAREPGPVVGLTAAIHGNEINGVRVVHRLLEACPVSRLLRGTLIAVPVVNMPGFVANRREFYDGSDLNRMMPGRTDGNSAERYAHRFLERLARRFEYHVDLHTASFGRINTLYARADMHDPVIARMARLMHPEIIVHNPGGDHTLRGALAELGVHAVTLEIGDPLALQYALIRKSRLGIQEILEQLEMIPDLEDPEGREPVECDRSYWIYTHAGGILDVMPELGDRVREGDRIARLIDVWGAEIDAYEAPEDGIVVGKSTNPVARPGSRILHLGHVGRVEPRAEPRAETDLVTTA